MNKIKFGDEHLALEKWMRGVYKIVFNKKWFYIGGTIDLRRRLGSWKCRLQKGDFRKNGSIKFILPEVEEINFEVLEIVPDGVWVKKVENDYLEKFFEDEFCLNLTKDAVNGKGRKLPLGKLPKVKKVRGPVSRPKPVAQFDLEGKLIKKHKSISAAATWMETKSTAITDHLKVRGQKTVKGYIFKLIDDNGNYIEHEIYKNKMPPGRKFYQIDKEGNIVAEFYNVSVAAKALGFENLRKNVSNILNGVVNYKTCKGFTYKYADD